MKMIKLSLLTLCIILLLVTSLYSINTNIPLERLPLEADNQTISWTLAGVQNGIPAPVDSLNL